jgi:hypothetical protein
VFEGLPGDFVDPLSRLAVGCSGIKASERRDFSDQTRRRHTQEEEDGRLKFEKRRMNGRMKDYIQPAQTQSALATGGGINRRAVFGVASHHQAKSGIGVRVSGAHQCSGKTLADATAVYTPGSERAPAETDKSFY